MANQTFPYADPGRAAFEVLDTYMQNFLLAGNHPELAQPYSFTAEGGTTLEQFSVVGLNGSGYLALATEDGTVQALGVLAQAFDSASDSGVPVYYQGCFNMDALVWDASFDTDAKKEAAFRGAPTPTQIIVAKRG
jgi:hypothetical protein